METEKPKEKFLLKYMTVALRDMEWIFRKSEKHWLDRAGDYDSKYGGTTGVSNELIWRRLPLAGRPQKRWKKYLCPHLFTGRDGS
jgi:hypothetical protein